ESFAGLLQAMMDTGNYQDALYLALLFDPCEKPLPVLIQAAFMANWYNLFNELLLEVKDNNLYSYWMERYHRIQGEYKQAAEYEFARIGINWSFRDSRSSRFYTNLFRRRMSRIGSLGGRFKTSYGSLCSTARIAFRKI